MQRLTRVVRLFAVSMLGITAGAMLAEAAILVPFWKGLSQLDFINWYAKNQAMLVNFYSPLEIWSAVLALLACILMLVAKRDGKWFMVLATLFSLFVILTFFVFFKDANAAFNARSIAEDQLPLALATWGNWQWFRVGLGVLAFAFGLLSIQSSTNN